MRAKKILLWTLAWIGVIAGEAIAATAAAGAVAMVMIPLAKAERGYDAVGGEWLVIGAVLIATFYLIHRKTCNLVFGKRKQIERWME